MKMSNLVNAFKATGICPFNIKAIYTEKYGPSTLYSDTTLSQVENSKGEMLTAIENEMKPTTVKLYTQCFNEGYDIKYS